MHQMETEVFKFPVFIVFPLVPERLHHEYKQVFLERTSMLFQWNWGVIVDCSFRWSPRFAWEEFAVIWDLSYLYMISDLLSF